MKHFTGIILILLLGVSAPAQEKGKGTAKAGTQLSLNPWDGPKSLSLFIARKIEDPRNRAAALRDIALALVERGDRQQSLVILKQALEAEQKIERAEGEAETLMRDISLTLAELGEFKQAVEVARKIKNAREKVEALSDITTALIKAGDKQQALAIINQAVEVARKIEDARDKATALFTVAMDLSKAGEGRRAMELADKAEDALLKAHVMFGIAMGLSKAGELKQAMGMAQKAEGALSRLDPNTTEDIALWIEVSVGYAYILLDIGLALAKTGDPKQAMEVVQKIEDRDFFQKKKGLVLGEIVAAFARAGEIKQAREVAHKILSDSSGMEGQQSPKTFALRTISMALVKAGDGKQAVDVAHTIGDVHGRINAVCDLALIQLEAGDRQQALAYLKQAVELAWNPEAAAGDRAYPMLQVASALTKAGELKQAMELKQQASAFMMNVIFWRRTRQLDGNFYRAQEAGLMLETDIVRLARAGGFKSAMEVTRTIENVRTRKAVLQAIARALVEEPDPNKKDKLGFPIDRMKKNFTPEEKQIAKQLVELWVMALAQEKRKAAEPKPIDASKVEQRKDSLYYLKGEKRPFTGSAIKRHKNGTKIKLEPYKNGKLHGIAKEWCDFGMKLYETSWNKGVKHGPHYNLPELEVVLFKDDKLHGIAKRWYENGGKKFETSWNMGVRHGPEIRWTKEGNKVGHFIYNSGKLEYKKTLELMHALVRVNEQQLGVDHPDVAGSYYDIGDVYKAKGGADAIFPYGEILNFHKGQAIWLKREGDEHYKKDWYDEALESYQKSLNILINLIPQEDLNHLLLAKIYNGIGKAHRMKGEYAKAREYLQKALTTRIENLGPNNPHVADSYNNIGTVHIVEGEYDHALEYLQKALAIRLKQEDPEHADLADSYNNIGITHANMGQYDKAIKLYQQALAIRIENLGPNNPRVADSYNNIGTVHIARGEIDKAKKFYEKSLAIYLQVKGQNHPDVADSYNNIGMTHRNMGQYDQAKKFYEKSLAIYLQVKGQDHPDVANSYSAIGQVYIDSGEYERAVKSLQKGLNIYFKQLGADHPFVATSHFDLGYAQYGMKNTVAALASAREARAISEKRLAYVLSFTSERERLAYQRTQKPFALLGTLGSAPDLAKAVLHNKGIVLSSLLEDQLAAEVSLDPRIKKLSSSLRAASRQLNKLEMENPKDPSEKGWKAHRAKREAARTKAEALQKQLARTVTGFGEARASLSLTIKDVQGKLAKDAALVEYIIYNHYAGKDQIEERYGAIILPKTGEPKWVPLGPTEAINKLLSKYSPLKPTDDEAYEEVLRGLHDKLMGPVLKQLPKGTKTLILSPDGPLNFLSFATLLTEEDTFLCEEYTLKYVSSGRDLVKEFIPSQGSLAVYANPAYTEEPVQLAGTNGAGVTLRSVDRDELRGGLQFKALPGTQKEADYLKGKAADWKLKPEIHVGKAATEAAISQVKNPYILHLATHGFFLPESKGGRVNPMHRSGLAFAGAQKTLDAWAKGETPPTNNDGILTAAEASVLDLKGTWLVTLSACETGRGEARSGEGVLGLRRAFIQAGAQNLLMTLWPVSDKYTIPFMKEFYERAMADGNAPESLAAVQKKLLVRYREVFGTKLAVQLAGPFIMSFQGAK